MRSSPPDFPDPRRTGPSGPAGRGPGDEADVGPPWPYLGVFVLLVLLGVTFGAVAREARVTIPGDLDHRVTGWVAAHRAAWPGLTTFFGTVTRLGNPEFAYPATILIALILVVLHRRGLGGVRAADAFFWVGVALGGQLLSTALKLWFRRERPPMALRMIREESFSFPSGHSIFSAIFFCLAADLLVRTIPASRRRLRAGLVSACLAVALLVAASRVWLGVHYVTDVAGGFLLGLAWGLAAVTIRRYWRRHRLLRGLRRGGAAAP